MTCEGKCDNCVYGIPNIVKILCMKLKPGRTCNKDCRTCPHGTFVYASYKCALEAECGAAEEGEQKE